MQQCRGRFRERDVNKDPEIIATITRSVKRGGSGKRRRERSLFPAPRVFRLHFPKFLFLYYITLTWRCNRLSSTWAVISKKHFTGQYYSSLKQLIKGFLALAFLQKQFLQFVSKFQMKSYILNHDFTSYFCVKTQENS